MLAAAAAALPGAKATRRPARHSALTAVVLDAAVPAAVYETLQLFWSAPFPVTLQDETFRIVDVNDAFVEFSGYSRSALIGRDPIELQPEEDRAVSSEHRRRLTASRGGRARRR